MNKLITSLNLDPHESHGQTIYNSQLYGTFFGVYAFIKSKEIDGNNKERRITSLTLEVVNYKGELDLGIEKAVYKSKGPRKGGTIYLTMRALIGNSLNNNTAKTEDIEVENIQGELFEKGNYINVVRYLKPIHSENSEDSTALNEGVFDSEFHYREGKVVKGYTLKPKSINIGGRPTEPKGVFAPNSEAGVIQSGIFCPFAELFILWFG